VKIEVPQPIQKNVEKEVVHHKDNSYSQCGRSH